MYHIVLLIGCAICLLLNACKFYSILLTKMITGIWFYALLIKLMPRKFIFLEQIFFRLAAWKFKQFQIFNSNIKFSHASDKVYNAKPTLWIKNTTYVYSLSYSKILFQNVKLTNNYLFTQKEKLYNSFFLLFIYFFCEGRQDSEFCSMQYPGQEIPLIKELQWYKGII